MKIAITGANGFAGSHLAARLMSEGHDVVQLAGKLDDVDQIQSMFGGCHAVAHCADHAIRSSSECLMSGCSRACRLSRYAPGAAANIAMRLTAGFMLRRTAAQTAVPTCGASIGRDGSWLTGARR